jgi:alpha-1,2-mannosyltransferase
MSANSLASRFRSGEWLSKPLAIFAASLMAAGTAVAILFLVFTTKGTLDYQGRPLGTDFSSFYSAGKMALDGRAAQTYDWKEHFAMQRQIHGSEQPFPWIYPPIFLFMACLFAMLPYVASFLIWQGASLAAALAVYRRIIPDNAALLFALGFPAVLVCIGHGQTGFLTAALMAGGLIALQRNEILAGVLFGLLAYKPQFGVLLPFIFIAGGYWRAFIAASITVFALTGATFAVWGWPVWEAFFKFAQLTREVVVEEGNTGFYKYMTAFAWVRMWGAGVTLAYAVQAIIAIFVFASCVWMWRSSQVPYRLKAAALLTGSLLLLPYSLDYDLVAFGMALAFLAAEGIERGFKPWDKTLIALAWFSPLIARTVAEATLIPLGFLALLAVYVLIVVRAREATKLRSGHAA